VLRTPLDLQGLIAEAKANAAYNIEKLSPYVEQGIPIVGVEPSLRADFRDEYPSLVDEPRTERLAKHVLMIEEFLVRLHDAGQLALPLHQRGEVGPPPRATATRRP